MKKWTKKKTLTAVTGAAVIGAATAALGNASSLETLFNPNKFEKYENRHRTDDYDYVAGNGGEAELANKDKNGNKGTDDSQKQQVLQVTEQEQSQNEQKKTKDDTADLSIADQNSSSQSDKVNKNAVEVAKTDNTRKNTSSGSTTAGNTTSSGTNSNTNEKADSGSGKGNGNGNGSSPSDKKNNNSGNGGNNQNGGQGDNNKDNNGGNNNPGSDDKPGDNTPDSTPTPAPSPADTWKKDQLTDEPSVETEDGTLFKISAEFGESQYFRGDSFRPNSVTVTAYFKKGKETVTKTLSYGRDGYRIDNFKTASAGRHTAIIQYKGFSCNAFYTVNNQNVGISYMAPYTDANGVLKYYSSSFPGTPLKGYNGYTQLVAHSSGAYVQGSSGGTVDLTEIHRWMIAYLGDAELREKFGKEKLESCEYVEFFNEENGYLTNMLTGFMYSTLQQLHENRTYLYYPMTGWTDKSRNVINVMQKVPDGYKIRRVAEGDISNLATYVADQVLEEYTGDADTINVPMGTTGINLKKPAAQVKTMLIPESVLTLNAETLGENLPSLENYAYANGETEAVHGTFRIEDGILYSSDGKTLLSVPAGRKNVTIPKTVTKLGKGCLKGLSADCVVQFEGTVAPALEGETGYKGTVLTQDASCDTICKAYMFRFGKECANIRFASAENKKERYQYMENGPVLTKKEDTSVLMGIPQDTKGEYRTKDGITAIGAGAFAGCTKLTDVVFSENVTELENESLILTDNVDSVTLAGGNVEIGSRAFGDPKAGAKVPDITIYVGEEYYDTYLKSWSEILDPVYGSGTAQKLLAVVSDSYIYENGVKYQQIGNGNKAEYRLVSVYDKSLTSLQIKEGTAEISAKAFAGCDQLEILCIPDSVKTIDSNTFKDCSSLKKITCADEKLLAGTAVRSEADVLVKKADFAEISLEDGMLYGTDVEGNTVLFSVSAHKSGSIQIKAGTSILAKGAFEDCSNITDLQFEDESLKEIGEDCFAGCSSLKTLTLPDAVTALPDGAFRDCSSLETLNAQKLISVGNKSFYGCSSLENLAFIKEAETLGKEAFYGCASLTEAELPDTLTDMDEGCFRNCVSVQKVTIDGTLKGIGRYCFYGCRLLREITFGDTMQRNSSLQVIGVKAFSQCIALENVDLKEQNALTQIGQSAFEGCTNLIKVNLPEGITGISQNCFADCAKLSILQINADKVIQAESAIFGESLPSFVHIWVKEEMAEPYRKEWKSILDPQYGEGTAESIIDKIDEKREYINGVEFENTDEGKVLVKASPQAVVGEYIVPTDTVRIAEDAFAGCTGLTELLLPKGSTIRLGDRCFKGCTGLTALYIQSEVPEWGEETFMDCTGLQIVQLGAGGADAMIPRIGTRAFKNCTGISASGAVKIYASIPVWGEECFAGCTNLMNVAFEQTATYYRIADLQIMENGVFRDCVKLSAFLTTKFTGLTSIGDYAFANCDTLKGPSIPPGVTHLGVGCFMDCDNLTTVSIYGAVEEYPKDCFKNCPKLQRTGGTAAAFGGLKRIGESAYEGCTSLVVPANKAWHLEKYTALESIGDRAFYGCATLQDNALSATVTSIGNDAFDGCVNMHTLTIKATQAPAIGNMDLTTMAADFAIRVPDSKDSEDSVYKDYLEALTAVLGEENAYNILDSISDGAKERFKEEKEAKKPEEAKVDEKADNASDQEEQPTEKAEENTEQNTGDSAGQEAEPKNEDASDEGEKNPENTDDNENVEDKNTENTGEPSKNPEQEQTPEQQEQEKNPEQTESKNTEGEKE